MRGVSVFLSALAAVINVGAAPTQQRTQQKALYFLDNNPSGASVVSIEIAQDGTLSNPVRTATGGVGLIGLTAMGPSQAGKFYSLSSFLAGICSDLASPNQTPFSPKTRWSSLAITY
jgi:hypothetical protein